MQMVDPKALSHSLEIFISTPHHLQKQNREMGNMMVWGIEMYCYWFVSVMFNVRATPIPKVVERILGLTNVLHTAEFTFN